MSNAVADSILSVLQNVEDISRSEINLTVQAFDQLYQSNDAQIPKNDLYRDLMQLAEVLERIRQAETPSQKANIFYKDYKRVFEKVSLCLIKYSEIPPSPPF